MREEFKAYQDDKKQTTFRKILDDIQQESRGQKISVSKIDPANPYNTG